jgi:hypothetical protein
MPSVNSGSPFTQASQSAKALGAAFSELAVLNGTFTTGGTLASIAHGLTGTPDFVVATLSTAQPPIGAEKDSISWLVSGNTVTLYTPNTAAATRPITGIVGVLA